MKIGFCGAHRTGKTSSMIKLSEDTDLNLIPIKTKTSKIFSDNSMSPDRHYEFSRRLDIQLKILDYLDHQYAYGGDNFVTDRTPFDLLSYTLCDVNNDTSTIYESSIAKYAESCFLSIKRFDRVFIIQPHIPVVYEDGKASLNSAYLQHINCTSIGLFITYEVPFTLVPKTCLTLQQRHDFIKGVLKCQ